MSVVYALEEATASTGPWLTVVGSPFSTPSDVVTGLNASTSYFFRITAKDTVLGISSTPTVVGPVVTSANQLAESAQNTRISSSSASTVPPVGPISGGATGSSLNVSWAVPTAIYDSALNVWSLYSSAGSVPSITSVTLTSTTTTSLSLSWPAPATSAGGVQVVRDGVVFQATSNVQQVVYWNHNVWMESAGSWFYYGGDSLGGNWIPAPGDPAVTESIQQTDVTDSVSVIIGPQSGSWQINSAGQISHNGVADTSTSGTVEVLYWNHTVYRKTSSNAWFQWNGSAWVSALSDPRTNSALGQSPDGTFVTNTTWLIVDATGAVWTLTGSTGSFQINRNSVSVQGTANVVELLYYQGAVYQATVASLSVVTPGSGSITDINGNVWSIDSGGNVLENGTPVNGGSGTGALSYDPSTNTIYGQDAVSGNWFYWNGSDWTGPVALPSGTGLLWKFWNNGSWSSIAGDPRVLGAHNANNPVFFDDFLTLNLRNPSAPVAGTIWQPGGTFGSFINGQDINGVWVVNPFNPATPFNNIYTASNSILSVRIDNTPSGFSSAVGGDQFVGGRLHTFNTFMQQFGYWEIQAAVPNLSGSDFSFWLNDQTSRQQINIFECVSFSSGAHYAAFSVWDPATTTVANAWYTYQMASPVDVTQMHTYGAEVTSTQVSLYIDRVLQVTFPLPAGYVNPMFMFMDYDSAGPAWTGNITQPGLLPVFAQVGYVGFWSSRPF